MTRAEPGRAGGRESRPGGRSQAAQNISTAIKSSDNRIPATADTARARAAVDHLEHFQRRVIQDALADGWAATWERRARAFEAARPALGDFTGGLDLEKRRAKYRELTEIAKACRAKATLAPLDLFEADLDQVVTAMEISNTGRAVFQ